MENVIYRYWHNGEVVYVGQTGELTKRIKQHCKEIRFYGITEVDYYELKPSQDKRAHEAYWINYYKPILNIQRPSLATVMRRKPKVKWKKYPYEIVYDEPLVKWEEDK